MRQPQRRRRMAADQRVVVGCDHHRGAQPVQLLEQLHQPLGLHIVQVAGRFIGQQQARAADHRARDRHPLLLAAGQFAPAARPPASPGPPSAASRRHRRGSAPPAGRRCAAAAPRCRTPTDAAAGGNPGTPRRSAGAAAAGARRSAVSISVPKIASRPRVGRIARYISRSRLVLPAPDGPSSQRNAPSGSTKLRSCSTSGPASASVPWPARPYLSPTPSNRTMRPVILAIPRGAPEASRHCFARPAPSSRTSGGRMRIVCPSCSAAYDVPDSLVTAGRSRAMRAVRRRMDARGGRWRRQPEPPPPPTPTPPPVADGRRLSRQTVVRRQRGASVRDGSAGRACRAGRRQRPGLRLAWAASLVLLALLVWRRLCMARPDRRGLAAERPCLRRIRHAPTRRRMRPR